MNSANALCDFISKQNVFPLMQAVCDRRRIFLDALLLLVLTLLIRLPYFVPTVIHWHESTYTILGQDILNGHLPQTFYSELKPPAAGVPYALFILLFGKSIASIRLGGALCVWLASVVVNIACRNRFGNLSAFFASLSVIIFTTTDDRAGCTMLEHIALVPLSFVAFLFACREWTTKTFFQIGLVIGLSALLKTNLAFFALAPLVMTIFKRKEFAWNGLCKRTFAVIAGVAIPQLIILLIYWTTGNFNLWIHSTLIASFASASYQRDQFLQRVPEVLQQIRGANPAAFFLCWALPFGNFIRILRVSEKLGVEQRWEKEFLIAMASCIICGFVTMLVPGVIHARRYYIALVPFTASMAAAGFHFFISRSKNTLYLCVFASTLLFSLLPVAKAYGTAWMFISGKKTDENLEVAKYLAARSVKDRYVYFHTAHIGLWLTDAQSPTRFIHPTNMDKSEILATLSDHPSSPKQELDEIVAKRPIYVVTRLRAANSEESAFTHALDERLKESYLLEKRVHNIGIFRINDNIRAR